MIMIDHESNRNQAQLWTRQMDLIWTDSKISKKSRFETDAIGSGQTRSTFSRGKQQLTAVSHFW